MGGGMTYSTMNKPPFLVGNFKNHATMPAMPPIFKLLLRILSDLTV